MSNVLERTYLKSLSDVDDIEDVDMDETIKGLLSSPVTLTFEYYTNTTQEKYLVEVELDKLPKDIQDALFKNKEVYEQLQQQSENTVIVNDFVVK